MRDGIRPLVLCIRCADETPYSFREHPDVRASLPASVIPVRQEPDEAGPNLGYGTRDAPPAAVALGGTSLPSQLSGGRGVALLPDLVFPGPQVAVFVDGCFWHGCPDHASWPKANAEWWRSKIDGNCRRDAEASRALAEAGWLVLRFWEHEPVEVAASVVKAAVISRRAPRPCVGP